VLGGIRFLKLGVLDADNTPAPAAVTSLSPHGDPVAMQGGESRSGVTRGPAALAAPAGMFVGVAPIWVIQSRRWERVRQLN
jgi:hypothetical protein